MLALISGSVPLFGFVIARLTLPTNIGFSE
jgi:hypothetical protein